MSKPEFSKPFCLEHAKAGAPYCCRDGHAAHILKWDRNVSDYPLLGVIRKSDDPRTWTETGSVSYAEKHTSQYDSDLVMLPFGMCQSKPVFMGDELVTRFGDKFVVEKKHIGDLCEENTWPVPAPAYPVTRMQMKDFDIAIISSGSKECVDARAACAIANAAIASALIDGDVVLPGAQHNNAEREMAIAEAAAKAAYNKIHMFGSLRTAYCDLGLDLAAIIASVTGAKDAQSIDFSIKNGDMVYRKTWGGGKEPVEVVNINWALKAIAVKLSPTGATVVWPVAGMTKDRFSEDAKEARNERHHQ